MSSVIASCLFIGLTGYFFAANILNGKATQMLEAKADLCSEEVKSKCNEIVCSTEAIAALVKSDIPDDVIAFSEDSEAFNAIVEECKNHAENVANSSFDDCIMYLRFNPEIFDPKAGFYVQRLSKYESFFDLPITDFSKYTAADVDKVGWYYIPIENGRGTWMDQYFNPTTGEDLLSYVVPIYKNGYPIAVMGIDLNVDVLDEIVDEKEIFESGFSFIVDENKLLLCHSNYEVTVDTEYDEITDALLNNSKYSDIIGNRVSFVLNGRRYIVYGQAINERLTYVMVVPYFEIYNGLEHLLLYFVGITFAIAAVIIVFTANYTDDIVKPLKKLTKASERIATGDYNVEINIEGDDEVAQLSKTIKHMANELNKYMGYISRRAYIDGLTGLKNKTAYLEDVKKIMEKPPKERVGLTIFVMDVNELKYVNDKFGHEIGDIFLIDTATIIKNTFGDESSYRIGGDEFVAVVEDCHEAGARTLKSKFIKEMRDFNKNSHLYDNELVIAMGYDYVYEDEDFETAFTRADGYMYDNKNRIKNGEDWR